MSRCVSAFTTLTSLSHSSPPHVQFCVPHDHDHMTRVHTNVVEKAINSNVCVIGGYRFLCFVSSVINIKTRNLYLPTTHTPPLMTFSTTLTSTSTPDSRPSSMCWWETSVFLAERFFHLAHTGIKVCVVEHHSSSLTHTCHSVILNYLSVMVQVQVRHLSFSLFLPQHARCF